ncbi:MAG TPA: hypothetical protein VF263_07765 [Longimicrobiaceae bacterium]
MRSTRAKRWIFSGAVTVALGFGAVQAFASPARAPGTARTCDPQSCNTGCLNQGYFGGGECVDVNGRMRCLCLYW